MAGFLNVRVQRELPAENFYTTVNSLNVGGFNQSVAYRYSRPVRFENGAGAETVYVIAFMDHENDPGKYTLTGYNDYVVEITLMEPVAE